jgi:hypothetical protein
MSQETVTRHKQPGVLDDYLDEDELAAQLGVSKRTLRGWRARGIGPAFVKYAKLIKYPQRGVPVWLGSLERKSRRR